jgi:hypothetical protein
VYRDITKWQRVGEVMGRGGLRVCVRWREVVEIPHRTYTLNSLAGTDFDMDEDEEDEEGVEGVGLGIYRDDGTIDGNEFSAREDLVLTSLRPINPYLSKQTRTSQAQKSGYGRAPDGKIMKADMMGEARSRIRQPLRSRPKPKALRLEKEQKDLEMN